MVDCSVGIYVVFTVFVLVCIDSCVVVDLVVVAPCVGKFVFFTVIGLSRCIAAETNINK